MPKKSNLKYYEAVGRRKSATARVRLYIFGKQNKIKVGNYELKKGEIIVNGKDIEQVFLHQWEKEKYLKPLKLTDTLDRFGISIVVKGGGLDGQLDAITHGIARALNKVDSESYRPVLKSEGLLTRDPRVRERRKVGTGGKARRKKQSPKR
ncbi:MAG: 30S ribosomal protein S9 [Patescibacteria group bacterium]|nr:MAG: 30S ribosomal protein S9 [Patescibacteria group bacterium]